jgi:hypothetical protein
VTAVRSQLPAALGLGMDPEATAGTLPFHAGDADWVADLFETFRAGDLDAAVARLEELLGLMRRAAKARRMLATLEPSLLREGLAAGSVREDGPA